MRHGTPDAGGRVREADVSLTPGSRVGGMDSRKLGRVERIAAIVDLLSAHEPNGLRFTQVEEACGLAKATLHRALDELSSVGFVSYDADDHTYHLGDRFAMIARRASARFDLSNRLSPWLERLSQEFQDTVCLVVVRGHQMMCVERLIGEHHIQAANLRVGESRPLGVGSAGMAVAAAFPSAVVDEVLVKQAEWRRRFVDDDAAVLAGIDACRTVGYAMNRATVSPDLHGTAVAIFDETGRPVAGISIMGLADRFAHGRAERMGEELLRVKNEIESRSVELLQSASSA